MKNAPEVQYFPIDAVQPYARHARIHNRRQRRKLEALLRRYGQVIPILVDEDCTVVGGHAVLEAMKALGYSEIMAVMVSGRDPAEVRALRLALTRRGDVVLDSLLGSGSTLLAAEEIGRICIGIELDPEYVDFAIRRWQHRTGKDAVEVVSGEAFDALADRRPDGAIKDQADASGSGLDETPGDDREDRSHD